MPIPVQGTPIWVPPAPAPPSTTDSVPGASAAEAPLRVNIRMFRQKKKNWCWAACIQMITDFYQTQLSQCDIAQELFTTRDCCNNSNSCDEGCDPEDVKDVLRKDSMQIECRRFSRDLSFETISDEIQNQRPVAAAVLWFSHTGEERGGHLIIIKGVHIKNNRRFVKVNDPFYGRGDVPFSKLKSYYGPDDDDQDGVWKHTWIKIAR